MKKNTYRLDIQGLRAIAVLCVVIFHISPEHLPGGFIGVDMFFVISGYLIIGHIARDLKNNAFSLLTFYSKRVVRLFPAYIVLMIFCFIFAYFLLLPSEFSHYINSAITSLFYVSNFWFYSQSGYFDNALQMSPLLHTWSLSVEEQFYIVFPLLLMWISLKSQRFVITVLVIIAIISFLISELQLNNSAPMAFFLSPFRFWQFIIGGLLSLVYLKIPSKNVGTIAAITGLTGIIFCLFFYNKNTSFPGVNALIPTFATALLIYSGTNNNIVTSRLLSWPIATFFGHISYSFYLWHWPIIIFYKYAIDYTITRYHMLAVFLLSVLLGYLSYKFVESPTRKIKLPSKYTIVGSLLLSGVFCIIMFFSIKLHDENISADKKKLASYLNYKPDESQRLGSCFLTSLHNDSSYFKKSTCVEFDPNKKNILLIGDSHAAHWYGAMQSDLMNNETLTQITVTGCKPIIAYEGREVCTQIVRWAYEELLKEKTFDIIILSARWKNRDIASLKETINLLKKYNSDIVVLGPIVEYEQDLPRILAVFGENNTSGYAYYQKIKSYDLVFKNALKSSPARYISVIDLVCKDDNHCISVADDNIPLQFDYGHLTESGAELLLKKLNDSYNIFNR